MARYADDAVMVFKNKDDAEKVVKVLGKRLKKFGLELNENKTHLVQFSRPDGMTVPETFDFLGFTLYWGKTLKRWTCS